MTDRVNRGENFRAPARPEEAKPGRSPEALIELTKVELLELAEERGVDVPQSATKQEIVDALNGADA